MNFAVGIQRPEGVSFLEEPGEFRESPERVTLSQDLSRGKVQRLERKLVGPSGSKRPALIEVSGDDIVWSVWEHAASCKGWRILSENSLTHRNSATWGLNQILPLFNGGALVFYNNPQPSTPETALAVTNTALATFVFAAAAFGAPSFSTPNDAATASFVASSVTPGANGTVTFARATLKSVAWAGSATYATLFTIVSNSANYYILTKTGTAAASGGPSGTTNAVTDSGCNWAYYSATSGQNNTLADFSVGTGGTDIVIGSTSITTTVQVTIKCANDNEHVLALVA